MFCRSREEVLGVGVVAVDGQNLAGEKVGGGSITAGEGRQGAIEELVNRKGVFWIAHRLIATGKFRT
jgi:hypothetical protein